MARIWQEGFESGLPQHNYLEGAPNTQYFNGANITGGTQAIASIISGRSAYSLGALSLRGQNNTVNFATYTKSLPTPINELYLRFYFKYEATSNNNTKFVIRDTAIVTKIALLKSSSTSFKLQYEGADKATFTTSTDRWIKVDVYLKIHDTSGAYELRIDDQTIYSESNINTGNSNIETLFFGHIGGNLGDLTYISFDDIALNDTTGTRNNSWCGSGTIVGLIPKGAGNYSQFTTSQGWTTAETDSNTTTLKITGHGLSSDDVIYNVTRAAYRIVTVSDINTVTMTAITGQTEGDIIVAFVFDKQITAGASTSTSLVYLEGHNLESYDVFVNTSRSNAIRRVIYISGLSCYNRDLGVANYNGSTVTSQASGDVIRTFKVKQYPISAHWRAVSTTVPNPQYSNVQSSTLDQIDTFDMEELVADKGLGTNTKVIAVSHNTYAKEKGAGSQFKPVFRIGSTDYEGDTKSLAGGTLEYHQVFENSPATGNQWGLSEVDNLEAGVKVV